MIAERKEIAAKIAEYITKTGTENTTTGNYHFDFEEINKKFGTNFPHDKELAKMLISSFDYNVVTLVEIGEDFDIDFYLNYCPNCTEEFEKDLDEASKVADWRMYLNYLKDWADSHSGPEFYGMSPVCFDEWYGEENEEDEDDE